ncbi:hypothetical protein GCM10027610_056240 [Dactylosporangium cerinum]
MAFGAQVLLSATFAVAAVAKLRDLAGFRRSLPSSAVRRHMNAMRSVLCLVGGLPGGLGSFGVSEV